MKKSTDRKTEQELIDHRMFCDAEEAKELKTAYDKALEEHKTEFRYKGERLNTIYAKYLLSYLKMNGLQ